MKLTDVHVSELPVLDVFKDDVLQNAGAALDEENQWVTVNPENSQDSANSDFAEAVSPVTKRFADHVLGTVGIKPVTLKVRYAADWVQPNEGHLYSV